MRGSTFGPGDYACLTRVDGIGSAWPHSDASAQGRQRFVQRWRAAAPSGGAPSGRLSERGGCDTAARSGSGAATNARRRRVRAPRCPAKAAPASSPAPRILVGTADSEGPRQDSGGYRTERSVVRREPAPTQLSSAPAAPSVSSAPPRSAIRQRRRVLDVSSPAPSSGQPQHRNRGPSQRSAPRLAVSTSRDREQRHRSAVRLGPIPQPTTAHAVRAAPTSLRTAASLRPALLEQRLATATARSAVLLSQRRTYVTTALLLLLPAPRLSVRLRRVRTRLLLLQPVRVGAGRARPLRRRTRTATATDSRRASSGCRCARATRRSTSTATTRARWTSSTAPSGRCDWRKASITSRSWRRATRRSRSTCGSSPDGRSPTAATCSPTAARLSGTGASLALTT